MHICLYDLVSFSPHQPWLSAALAFHTCCILVSNALPTICCAVVLNLFLEKILALLTILTLQKTPCLYCGLYLSPCELIRLQWGLPCIEPGPIFIPHSSWEWLIWARAGRRGSPSYLPTMWSGPYIVMIVSATIALTSSYRFTSTHRLGWLSAK